MPPAVSARRRMLVPLAAASVAIVLLLGTFLFITLRARSDAEQVSGVEDPVILISPRGESGSRPISFIWHSHGAAALYRLEVLTPGGDMVFSTETRDTAVALPLDVPLIAGSTYQWSIAGHTPDGREMRSPPVSFTP